jgi:hypothetical protein
MKKTVTAPEIEGLECINFVPSKVEGLCSVESVSIYPDKVEIVTQTEVINYNFQSLVQRYCSEWFWRFKHKIGFRSNPYIGEKYFECPPQNRFFLFYTEPQIKVFMPADEPENWIKASYGKSQFMMHRGGYALMDMT